MEKKEIKPLTESEIAAIMEEPTSRPSPKTPITPKVSTTVISAGMTEINPVLRLMVKSMRHSMTIIKE